MADWISPAWSDWVKAVMQIVGINSTADLAVQIGLPLPATEQLLKMPSPPATLRGPILLNLARALKASQRTILWRWKFTPPEVANKRAEIAFGRPSTPRRTGERARAGVQIGKVNNAI
jgi:hypothetical protein